MKGLLILTMALVNGSGCASQSVPKASGDAASQPTQLLTMPAAPRAESNLKRSKQVEEKKEIPVGFAGIDFRNFAYPISWKHRTVTLKNGRVEYFEDKYLGNGWFELGAVDFIDFTGDGIPEAVVSLFWVSCGGSCDGGSHLFYFYSADRGKVKLLTRIETGSLGYECGLKSFVLARKILTLETFHVCRFGGTSIKPTNDPHPNPDARTGKFVADKFTQFILAFQGRGFVLAKRTVLPNPQEDIKNYSSKIEISQ